MADLRQTFADNQNVLLIVEFYEKADKATQSLLLAQFQKRYETAQQKQREELQRKRSFESLPQKKELAPNERNNRTGHFNLQEFSLQRTEQPHLKRRTQRRTQSQDHRRAFKREASHLTQEQLEQNYQRLFDHKGTFEIAPFSEYQPGLAKSQVDLRLSSLIEAQFNPLPSNSSPKYGVAAQQAYKQKKEQRQIPGNIQVERNKLKKSSHPLQKYKQWYDKCAIPPHAIYQEPREEQRLDHIAYRTAGRRSQEPSHHFPENQRNQLTSEEIQQHYSNNRTNN